MIVDEGEFSEMAERLGIEPKDLVNTVLDSIKSRPWYVARAGSNRSLGKSLQISLNSSEIAYAWNEAIKDVVGGREYIVEECDIDLKEGSIRYEIVFEEDDNEIDRLNLHFGDDPGETVSASVRVVFADGKLGDEAEKEIDEVLGATMIDCMDLDFEHDYYDGVWSFSVIVHASHDSELPEFDEVHELVKQIKKAAKAHGAPG